MERDSHVLLVTHYPRILLEEMKKSKLQGMAACPTAHIKTCVFLKTEHGTKKHYTIPSSQFPIFTTVEIMEGVNDH
jgi:hypothetical protein